VALTAALIAVVDDDPSVRRAIQNVLAGAKFEVVTFDSAEAVLQSADFGRIDCLVAEINLPGMSGVALVRAFEETGRAMPAVLLSERDSDYPSGLLGRAGMIPRLGKPVIAQQLLSAIAWVLLR
jgi:FixJ family two-component response regulator